MNGQAPSGHVAGGHTVALGAPRMSAGGGAGSGGGLTWLTVRTACSRLRAGSPWARLLGTGYGPSLWGSRRVAAWRQNAEGLASGPESSPSAATQWRSKRLRRLRVHGLPSVRGQKRDILPPPPSSPAALEPQKPSLPHASKFPEWKGPRKGTESFLNGGARREKLKKVDVEPSEGDQAGR